MTVHPQPGEVWQPSSGAVAVPVEAALWAEPASPPRRMRTRTRGENDTACQIEYRWDPVDGRQIRDDPIMDG